MKTLSLFLLLIASLAQSGFAQNNLEFPHDGVILGDKVRLRQEPSTKGTLITELPFGTAVDVLKLSSNSEKIGDTEFYHYWVQVQTPDGKKGWVFGKFVSEVQLAYTSDPFYRPSAPKGAFEWATAECQYSPYADLDKYSEDMMLGSNMYFLVDRNNPKALYPIRDPKKTSSVSAENYFQLGTCCCGTDCSIINPKQEGNSLLFTEETVGEGEEEDEREATDIYYTVQWKNTEFVITKVATEE